ncbi:MAG: hypothetical protein WBA61_15165 [Aequorivita sp.]
MTSQVGIGTTSPAPTSALDIQSNSQGLLVPRMTTAQRTAIITPANSLMVYDTDLRSFYYYHFPSTTWVKINASANQRDNYVLVKSLADLPAPSGGEITLVANTFYEINGTITLTAPINLNTATIAGLDAFEDVLSFPGGAVFKGNTGGNIKNVTLKGGKAFEITGPGISSSSSLIVQNVIVDGMTSSVGSISGLGLYFGNIIQYMNNTNGITYSNIGNLLLNNQGWFAGNNGTYETFTGTFSLIEKVSGFSTANVGAIAMDFSSNPTTVSNGVILNVVFSGTSTQFVKGYNPAPYAGYNFTNKWTVDSPGIPREGDANASGNMSLNSAVQTSFSTNPSLLKLPVTTTSSNLFRFEREVLTPNNKIKYIGSKKRYFQVNASISYESSTTAATVYILYIAKNGAIIGDTKVYGRTASSTRISSLPIVATIELEKDDYIEIWAERLSGSAQMDVRSLSLSID